MDDNRVIKTVLLEMVEGNRLCGRLARRRSDDIVDLCGCLLTEAVQLKRTTEVERNHWPQRLTWAKSLKKTGFRTVIWLLLKSRIEPSLFEFCVIL